MYSQDVKKMDWNTLPQKDKEMLIRTYKLRTNEDLEKFIDAFNRRKKQDDE